MRDLTVVVGKAGKAWPLLCAAVMLLLCFLMERGQVVPPWLDQQLIG
jgi:hypothetical protein